MAQSPLSFDIQGHRGARGLRPENTIPAFIEAVDLGVATLEMDVAVTRDQQIVVSHEPWMSALICTDSLGHAIAKEQERDFNIYRMDYEQVKKFDCGAMKNPLFSRQQPCKASKPLLADVLNAVEDHIKNNRLHEVNYSIEIKMVEEGAGVFHPEAVIFADLLYHLVDRYIPLDRLIVQCFDMEMLRYWHTTYPHVKLSALNETYTSAADYLDELGFDPAIYSPYYKLLSLSEALYLQAKNIKVVPWTVNEVADMEALRNMGVDGLITDYPDSAIKWLEHAREAHADRLD